MYLQGIRLISRRDFDIHDPLGEHTATLSKKNSRLGDIKIYFDTHDGNTLTVTGKDNDGNNELLLFDVRITNPKVSKYSWVINCACSPFRPLSMRFVPKGKAVEDESCFDVGIDEVLDLKVSENTKVELIKNLEEVGVDDDIARFVVDYGYFRSKKNDIFQVTNMIRFLGDEEFLDANAISNDGTPK